MNYQIEIAGVNSLLLRFSDQLDQAVIAQINWACHRLRDELHEYLVDIVPSYTSLLLTYDLLKVDDHQIRQLIHKVLLKAPDQNRSSSESRLIELPACYEPELAPDLDALCRRLDLTSDEIINLHSEREYSVFAIGFSPGFGYLGELDERLRIPRLDTPRTAVPRGSVAIAEANTAVYPQQTPGGWWLIGRCPLLMFDAKREPPCLFNVGDRVRFVAISVSEYTALGGCV